MKQFNMNDFVKVKLTEFGEKVYAEHYKQYETKRKLTRDDNGYSEFQLWQLMNIFGSNMYNGNKILFEGVKMLIKDKDLVNFEG